MDLQFLQKISFVEINTKYSKQGFKTTNNIFCFLKDVWYYFHKKKKPNIWDSKQ